MGSEHEDGRGADGGEKASSFLIWLKKGFGRTAGVRDERLLPSVSVRNLAFCVARSRKRAKTKARAFFATHFFTSFDRTCCKKVTKGVIEGAHFPQL